MTRLLTLGVFTLATAVCATEIHAQASSPINKGRSVQSGRTVSPLSVTDAFKVIYRVSGVLDTGLDSARQTATVFFCSNYSTTKEKIYFQIKDYQGTIVASKEYTFLGGGYTITAQTSEINSVYDDFTILPAGVAVSGGSAGILATTTNIHCSAMLLARTPFTSNGVALHMVRFNPIGGTSE